MDKLLFKIGSFFPDRVFEYFYSRFYMPILWRNPVMFENEGLFLFKNGGYFYKMSYIDYCDDHRLDWIAEMERCKNEAGING